MNKFFIAGVFLVMLQNVVSQQLDFKDQNFLKAVLAHEPKIDSNNDGFIQKTEADSVTELNLMEKGIQFMDDAYLFPNLKKLVLTRNNIKEVKLIGFQKMTEFYCAVNQVVKAEVKDMLLLTDLSLNFNDSLRLMNLENIPNLVSLSAEGGQLTSIDISIFPLLKHLSVSENKLSRLDVTKNPEMIQIRVSKNPLTELDIQFNPKLKTNILYVDSSVKLIATPTQERNIKMNGVGQSGLEIVK